jgi:hypothetical protein
MKPTGPQTKDLLWSNIASQVMFASCQKTALGGDQHFQHVAEDQYMADSTLCLTLVLSIHTQANCCSLFYANAALYATQ